jgi:hypothetical protein
MPDAERLARWEEFNALMAARWIAMSKAANPLRVFEPDMGAMLDAIVWEWPWDTAALTDLRRRRRDAATIALAAGYRYDSLRHA